MHGAVSVARVVVVTIGTVDGGCKDGSLVRVDANVVCLAVTGHLDVVHPALP